ncbi:hypothetical protein MA16_Dca005604 [Dendrobium catenatum]|uniref:Uncharacterized protein n=1 Tax=Dendrobium catenatum TaxID=906689 RepID=A0A2I0WQ30_9ASPA|nr:hypothetical protein MA16_Dca005604 [Dendrobium catenatum]
MFGYEEFLRRNVEAYVIFCGGRISKKDTWERFWVKFGFDKHQRLIDVKCYNIRYYSALNLFEHDLISYV